MKIKRFQQGGGFATFTPIMPNTTEAPVRPTSKKEETDEDTGSLLDKDVYKRLIAAGGLVNDVNNLVEEVSKLESAKNPYLRSSNRSSALQLMGKINAIIEAKEDWTKGFEAAKSSGGLGEVAVDAYKRVFTRGEDGQIKAMTLNEYKKSEGKFGLLSVAELLNARKYEDQLTGDRQIFSVANDSIGMDKITSKIKDMMTLLSEASVSSERHYSKQQLLEQIKALSGKTPTPQVLQAIQDLNEVGSTPGNYVKVTSKETSKRGNIKLALDYIWSTLNSSAQNKLEVVAAMNGHENPQELIYNMLYSYTEPITESKFTPEEDPYKLGTSKDSQDKKSLTVLQMVHKDKLMNKNTTFGFNDPKLGVLFRGLIGGVSPVVTSDGTLTGMQTMYNIFNNPKIGYGMFLNQGEATLGNTKLTQADMNNIIYDGKDAAKVYMPVDNSGNPDYASLGEFKELYNTFQENKDSWTKEQAENFFASNGYKLQVEEQFDGTKVDKIIKANNRVKPFYLMYGYTNDATDLIDGNEAFVSRLSNEEEKNILPYLKQIWTVGTGKSAKNLTPDGWGGEDYYKVMVATPYKEGYAAIVDAMVGQGPREKVSTIEQVHANLAGSQEKPMNTTNSDVLKNE